MSEYKLNSGFGYRRDPFRRRGALHTGLDFGGPRNAPVLATAPGTVVESGRQGAYGIMVVIDHGMGIETRYAHLSRALVRVGDRVQTGRKVGIMGRTGRATGHHLHYEIRVDGRPLNPKPFLEAGAKLLPVKG
jgi:murein DD-endopeptidase MepM/ murein hydrolase activator NlpD